MYNMIFINDLEVYTEIGVYESEKGVKQKLLVSIEIEHEIGKAVATDDLQYALDYTDIATTIEDFATTTRFALVESFASKLGDRLIVLFGLRSIVITVQKFSVKNARSVGVKVRKVSA